MIGDGLCLGIGGGDGFHILGLFGLGIDAQDAGISGIDGDAC